MAYSAGCHSTAMMSRVVLIAYKTISHFLLLSLTLLCLLSPFSANFHLPLFSITFAYFLLRFELPSTSPN
jgi:hypothetical protein